MNVKEDWEFIGNIPKGAKPCFYDKSLVHINEWFVTFKRRMKGEKGEKGIIYVENLIINTEKLDIKEQIKLRETLQSATVGLTNLVYTYKMDEQLEVSKSYNTLLTRVENLINLIDKHGRKNNFFSYVPKVIS